MHVADYLVVLGYLTLVVVLGGVFRRHQSRREFFAASGSMGWLVVGLSVMATLFSSNSFVMYPSATYSDSLRISLTLVSHTLITPLIMWVFIPVYTRLNCQTAYEYLEIRFHVSVRCLASGLFVFLRIGWMASATFAASLVMANVAGVDQTTVIVILGVVAITYTMFGGLRAVMWTDVVQFFIFAVTIFITLGLLFSFQSGNVSETFKTYFEGRDNLLFDFSPSLTLKFGTWAILIGIFLEALSAFGADQVAVQRYIAARSEKTAQLGFLVNVLGIWLVVPALLLIGVGLFAHYERRPQELVPLLENHIRANDAAATALMEPLSERGDSGSISTTRSVAEYYASHPERVAADVRAMNLQDQAMPQFVQLHFPPGLKGLFLAALMAAIMSSIDSGVHSVTTALVVDFRDRLFPQFKPASDRDDVRMIRVLIGVIGAVAVTSACFVGPLGDVFDIGKKLTAAFGGPLLGVFILALFFPKISTGGVILGTVLAAVTTMQLMYSFPEWFSVWFWPIGFGLSILLAVGFSLVVRHRRDGAAAVPLTFRNIVNRKTAK